MSTHLSPTRRVPPPDETAHADGQLMHELSQLNTMISRYILRHLDADAGRTDPIPTADDHVFADHLAKATEAVRVRASRHEATPAAQ